MALANETAASSNTPESARAKPARLQWEDPFMLDQQLTEEERMIRDTAHAYCRWPGKSRE